MAHVRVADATQGGAGAGIAGVNPLNHPLQLFKRPESQLENDKAGCAAQTHRADDNYSVGQEVKLAGFGQLGRQIASYHRPGHDDKQVCQQNFLKQAQIF